MITSKPLKTEIIHVVRIHNGLNEFFINSALYFLYSSVIVTAVVKRSETRSIDFAKKLLQGFLEIE